MFNFQIARCGPERGRGGQSLCPAAPLLVRPEQLGAQVHKLFGSRYVLESEHCAVVRTPDDGYAFGRFRYPRHVFEQIATYTFMAEAKRAFDGYNQARSTWRKTA